jgi:hypothetical protein
MYLCPHALVCVYGLFIFYHMEVVVVQTHVISHRSCSGLEVEQEELLFQHYRLGTNNNASDQLTRLPPSIFCITNGCIYHSTS